MDSVALKQQLIAHMDSLGQGSSEGTGETACFCLIMSGAKLEDPKSGFGTTSGFAQSHIWWLLGA